MQDHGSGLAVSGFQSALLFESPEEIYARVFREFKPRTPLPKIEVEFCRFANADSFIRMESGAIDVRISDLLEGAPAPVVEALAYILLRKLFRRPAARIYAHRYRLYLNRRDVRRQMHLVRQIRGRKFVSGPQGSHYNLEAVFEALNAEHFQATVEIGTLEILEGQLPRRALNLVGKWAMMHREELLEDWRFCRENTVPTRIEPLA